MNDIQRRVRRYIDDIDKGRVDWNLVIKGILKTDLKFYDYEIPTTERQVYFLLNQLIDILNLKRSQKMHGIPFEFADLFSMSTGYMSVYGNPFGYISHRIKLNSTVKGEKEIVEKYEGRYQKYGELAIAKLHDILDFHNDEDYFKELTRVGK